MRHEPSKAEDAFLGSSFFVCSTGFSRPTPTPHIFTRFLFQISNRCTMQRVSVRVARVLRHSYFPPPQVSTTGSSRVIVQSSARLMFFFFSAGDRCLIWLDRNVWLMWIVRQNSQNAAMQLNDWCPTCTLHSCVTSCVSNGLSSIEIVTVCDVQCPFCKLSLVTVESWMFTNHLAIKLESFHKLIFPGHWFPWIQNNYNYILYICLHISLYISTLLATTNYHCNFFVFCGSQKSYPRFWWRCQCMQAQTHLHMGQGPQHFLGLGCPRRSPSLAFPEINTAICFFWHIPGVSLEVGYLCMYMYMYIYIHTHKYRLI